MGVQRANMAADLYANLATADMFQRDYQRAANNIDRAMTAKYEPYKQQLQMEMFFLQRLDSRLEGTQRELSQAKQNEIQREFQNIDRTENLVNAVVSSGGATAEQLQEIMSIQDVNEQKAKAMQILSGINSADRALDMAYKQAQLNNINDQIRERNAKTTEGKPLTQAQYTALGYAERTVEAGTIIDQIGDQFASGWATIGNWLPNQLKTEDRQKFEQAQRNFVNAVLRRESGAAIAESEFESAAKQYFPQPGDSLGVLAQKKVNRETVSRNLLREGGQDITPQQNNINDPLGLGINTNKNVQDPLGIGNTNTGTIAF
jgi:hypothetical protein